MKQLPLFLVVLLGGFLLIGADGCSSDPNVEGAKLDLRNKDYDRALENLATALEKNPDNADAYVLKGQVLQEQAFTVTDVEQHSAMLKEMMAAYNRAIEIDPAKQANIENQLKLAYYNEFQRGIQAFNRGQQATDENKTEFSNAASHFQNAAVIFPDSVGAYVNEAYAYFSAGESEKAIQPFEMAIEKGDTSEDTYIYLADLYRTYDQPEKGIALLEEASTVYPENENIQAQLMNFYVASGREDEALTVYQNAVDKDPNNKLYRYNYGSLLLEMENYDGAIEQLNKAIEIDPEYANAHYNLGAAYVNKAVGINDEINKIDDDLRENRSSMSEDEIKQKEAKMEELADTRRGLFQSAIAPLEKAKTLAEAEGVESASYQGICQALFQSYVQTNQMDKAESVSECANVNLN